MLYNHGKILENANDSLAIIASKIRPGSKVLDVGCGAGNLATLLRGKNCRIWGIELDAENAAASEKSGGYEKVCREDLNDFDKDIISENFDYVVCADVLEHVIDPEKVAKRLMQKLVADGKFIISVPNVAHASIKANLLLNDWTYTELGIMDKTHLRFFTADSLAVFLSNLGLISETWDYTTLPLDGYQPHKLDELPLEIAEFIRNDVYAEVMQFVVVATPASRGCRHIGRANKVFTQPTGKKSFKGSKIIFGLKRLLLVKFPNLVKYIQRIR